MAICPGCGKPVPKGSNGLPRMWHNECYHNYARKEMGKLFYKRPKGVKKYEYS
jgi:hypothetical protein